jgi:hypothetical protein
LLAEAGFGPGRPLRVELVTRAFAIYVDLASFDPDLPELVDDRLIDLQSQELDRAKRLAPVEDIQKRLEADVARPMLGWRNEYFTQWPRVKNLIPHNSLYNYARMQEVWLDR